MAEGMVLGTAVLELSYDDSKLKRGLAQAKGAAEKAGQDMAEAVDGRAADAQAKSLQKLEKDIQKFSLAATAAFGVLGVVAVKSAADFEQGLDQVGAVSRASAKEMEGLRAEALAIGRDTAFGAGEATRAMEELAAGGRSAAQIIGGEARAAADLAAAGNYDLAESARTVATAMDLWGETGIETTEVVNRLAAAANVSRFGVDDMAQAIASGGGAAKVAKLSFEDFSTAIAATASAFSSGADAGTSLKTFLTALPGNSKEAEKAIRDLGLQFFNADGSMRSMAEIVDELHNKLGPLSEQQQIVALKTIFGNDALRTAAGLMKLTGEEFTAMSRAMESTNAQEIAAQRMGNLRGEVEELMGSLETLAINVMSAAMPAMTALTRGATSAVNAFGELPQSTQNLILLGTAAAAAAPLVQKWVTAIQAARASGLGFGSMLTSLPVKIGLVAAAVAGLDLALSQGTGAGLMDRIFGDVARMEAGREAAERMQATVMALGPAADKTAASMALLEQAAAQFGDATRKAKDEADLFSYVVGGSDGRLFGFNVGLSEGRDRVKEWEEAVKVAGAAMVQNGATVDQLTAAYHMLPPALRDAFDEATQVTAAVQTQSYYVEKAKHTTEGWLIAYLRANEAIPPTVVQLGGLAAAIYDAEDATEAFDLALEGLVGTFGAMNPAVRDLDVEIAVLEAELAELVAASNAETEAGKAAIAAKEAEIDARKKLRDTYIKDGDAIDALARRMVELAGNDREAAASVAGLVDAFVAMDVPANDTIANLSRVNRVLAETDASKALDELQELRDSGLNPELYAAAAELVGGTIVERIATGIADPAQRAELYARAEALGVDVVDGVRTGMRAIADSVAAEMESIARESIEAGRRAAQAHSPSRLSADLVGRPIAEGVALGIREGKGEALSAMEAFVLELLQDDWREQLTDEFGDLGADLVEALGAALEANAGASEGRALADAVDRLIEDAKAEGVPDAEALGQALIDAVTRAMEEKTPESVEAVRAAIRALTDAAQEEIDLNLGSWLDAWDAVLTDRRTLERLGSAGQKFMEAFHTALEEGGKKNIDALARGADDLVGKLKDKLPPAQAAYIATQFMSALTTAIETQSPEAIDALEEMVEDINTVLEGGAVDITNGLTYTSDQIKAFADELGVSARTVVDNITLLSQTGILGMLEVLDDVPDEVQKLIKRVLDDLAQGIIDAGTARDAIIGILKGIGGVKVDPKTGSATYEPPMPGTTGTIEQALTEILGFNPFAGGGTVSIGGYTLGREDLVSEWVRRGPVGFVSDLLYGRIVATKAPYDPRAAAGGTVSPKPGDVDPVTGMVWAPNPHDPTGRSYAWVAPAAVGAVARAMGGPVLPDLPYWVGELGPELFVPDSAGSIVSTRALLDLAGGGGGDRSFNVTIESLTVGAGADDRLVRRAIWETWEEIKEHEFGVGALQWGGHGA